METILSKMNNFEYLISEVSNCNLCKRMCNRKKVLSAKNGNLNSKVLFIAEAPGRLGAERTNTPLYGDKTGDNFEKLLGSIGWKRDDVFITNSVLCNPQKNSRNNRSVNAQPNCEELKNCNEYLEKTIKIINPDVIITLGEYALKALNYIKGHKYNLKDCVAKSLSWNNKYLFPLYHMSQTVLNIHRSMDEQKKDFYPLSLIVNPLKGLKS